MTKLRNRALTPSSIRSSYFPFTGGINLVDPALTITPGECVSADNFEVDIRGRYQRLDGYERADGQTLPSEVVYYRIPFTLGTSKDSVFSSAYSTAFDLQIPSTGDMIKGETSGALGSILQVSIEDVTGDSAAGSFAGSNGEGYVYFIVTSGTLQDGETLLFLNKDSAFGSAFNVEYK
jgi:hypothetical protein|tara:strand:- start:55 stop:588 length:534 start_codon:yes stop_codon:yes gene_type:complete